MVARLHLPGPPLLAPQRSRLGHIQVSTPSMVYNGDLKFQTSVFLRIPLYGSRNLAYIACKMDYMRPL